ncbi:hypothetical protein EBAPG3_14915 [Nitrosospira lacus]|nr:hypothetical protein EBAPG3_14915 [Nitrosospira lacus]
MAYRACPLWKNATQTIFGEGSMHASLMLVGGFENRFRVVLRQPWLCASSNGFWCSSENRYHGTDE